ncbi:replication initiator protein A [Rheinheimera fenheensis]|uniref:replication initiator protein A n=1 Tax=Rheinheimera fenheensis TaxID=3152295 RepID=UPI00325C4E5E
MSDNVFECNLRASYSLKSDLFSLELPIYAISSKSKKPVEIKYKDTFVRITPSDKGRATIKDKEIVIYCLSQLMVKLNNNLQAGRVASVCIFDFLKASGRGTSGRDYQDFNLALERLKGTIIQTNRTINGKAIDQISGIIESYKVSESKSRRVEVKLAEWIIQSALENQVLTLDPSYFGMKRSFEKRVYEVCRKLCGKYHTLSIRLENFHTLVTGTGTAAKFKRDLTFQLSQGKVLGYRVKLKDHMVRIYKDTPEGKKSLMKDMLAGIV